MRGGAEEDDGGDQCEDGEGQEAEPVQHDRGVLPVVHHLYVGEYFSMEWNNKMDKQSFG